VLVIILPKHLSRSELYSPGGNNSFASEQNKFPAGQAFNCRTAGDNPTTRFPPSVPLCGTAGGQKFIPPRPSFLFASLLFGFAKNFSETDGLYKFNPLSINI
jgi:hypothetical protein